MKVNKSSFGGPARWTYDLKYEDCDRVKRSLIRVLSNGKSKKDKRKPAMSDSEMEEEEEPEELEVGVAIETKYGGKSKWYKGTVLTVNKSSFAGSARWTYDFLKYEDGDR